MNNQFITWFTQTFFIALTAILLTTNFAVAEDRASTMSRSAIKTMQAQTIPTQKEVRQFCAGQKVDSATHGNVITYSCGDTADSSSIQARPNVQRSDIDCTYTQDSDGNITWTGCTCTANEESNCTSFITNCAESGDQVDGNSGAASCSPQTRQTLIFAK